MQRGKDMMRDYHQDDRVYIFPTTVSGGRLARSEREMMNCKAKETVRKRGRSLRLGGGTHDEGYLN